MCLGGGRGAAGRIARGMKPKKATSMTFLMHRVQICRHASLAINAVSIILVALFSCLPYVAFAQEPVSAQARLALVDPFIGTGPDGHTFPGATVPFGMVQLSPDTQIRPFKQSYKWASGYRYEDTTILGFSHTHFSGSGHSDLGDVLLQPISGDVQLEPGDIEKPGSGYRSRFSHKQERAEPGYYAVDLLDYGIHAELTATAACRRSPLHLPSRQAGACPARSSFFDLQLSRQGALVAAAHSRRRHSNWHARDPRLGARASTLLRDPLLAAYTSSTACTTASLCRLSITASRLPERRPRIRRRSKAEALSLCSTSGRKRSRSW